MFGPSRVFFGTMASADFLRFVVTAHFLPCVRKTSPGTHTFFPSLPAAFTVSDSVQLLGFILSWKLALAYGLICDFYSSGQRFAAAFLQILPHGRHPWLKLYPSRCRADSGLSPFRTCAHRAHTDKAPGRRPGPCFGLRHRKAAGKPFAALPGGPGLPRQRRKTSNTTCFFILEMILLVRILILL